MLYCDVNLNDRLFPLQTKVIKLEANQHRKTAAINFLHTEVGGPGEVPLSVEDLQDIVDLEDIVVTESHEMAMDVLNQVKYMDIDEPSNEVIVNSSNGLINMEIGPASTSGQELSTNSIAKHTESGQDSTPNNQVAIVPFNPATSVASAQPSTINTDDCLERDALAGHHQFFKNVRSSFIYK